MKLVDTVQAIKTGEVSLGIELGSTRIKAVLIDQQFKTIASGSFDWENQLVDDLWTYSLVEVKTGIQTSYAQLAAQVQSQYHIPLTKIKAIGVSAMMHGYLAFDQSDHLLVPFRTWRNNSTQQAADELTKLFNFNIPQRYSIAHLYQAMLNQEPHVAQIAFITTLAGYVHWQLSGQKVLGVGDASGMFPIDNTSLQYDEHYVTLFEQLPLKQQYHWHLDDILPQVLTAGQQAGVLSAQGAKFLDPSGKLQAGSLLAPPEGDAGTGMVATNSVRQHTGNISVGTSAFSMVVLEQPLKQVHRDIDVVTTPSGEAVAMVHINNCSSDINAWLSLFGEFAQQLGVNLTNDQLYERLLLMTTHAQADAGGLVNYSYLSGENITQTIAGRPLFVRTPAAQLNLANFILAQLYAAFAPLKMGMDILTQEEHISLDVMIAQGGLFKTPIIAQQVLANALDLPITTMQTAQAGGPWGMAILASYVADNPQQLTLADFLDQQVFVEPESMTLSPEPLGVTGYQKFLNNYQAGLDVERLAGKTLKE